MLVTQDRTTIPACLHARLQAGTAVPGVVIARIEHVPLRSVIDALVYLVDVATPDDWKYPLFIP